MKISELLQTKQVTISCELFPPKKGSELEKSHEIVKEMAKVKPSFMSVTYGASGGISEHTVDLANEVQNVNGILALAHLTCASSGRDKIQEVLKELQEHHIENILALRGDIPEDVDFPLPNQYHHASELIEEIKNFGDFCIGGACYPEGHPEAESLEADIDNLKRKVDAGCEFLTTQMFFDNNILYNFLYKTLKRGIEVPIIAGIMPVTNVKQIKRITSLSGTILPQRFCAIVERFADYPAALKQAGIAYATDQIIDLIANGVNHVHIYTMNKPDVAGAIFHNLSEIYNLPG
ncbi:methylenetetrahydrofolate reductase [NAD(P)H] [Petralouisia muris]|uniref:Methylenetetrahydrofolate reductase [NAD(P)H] n=1 Tax=Petralouisia muris TaxID=3032872 RepID=A0AC61RYC5_9FIRM|nr:methylenetetrahydrofolate reductase [NAD(P)H] [Petralouisia muris]TGY96769.1 methylenetetrahydrofolate reductase [NAD(P)H] [Petralouisia muris]